MRRDLIDLALERGEVQARKEHLVDLEGDAPTSLKEKKIA